jgi:RNA polymerase sigma-70 factor (ECF subfamily)
LWTTVDDEDRLLRRNTDRDFTAFEAIYERFHRLVYAIAFQVLGAESGAEDVTQSVFITVWTAPQRYRGGSFRRWIAAVARNRALDVLRAGKPHLALTDVERTLAATDGIQDAVLTRIEAERARLALEALPPPQRGPIELAFFGGLTHEQIATRTATPLGTVKSRIRSGLRALRVTLETGVA